MNKSNKKIISKAKWLIKNQGTAMMEHAFQMADVNGDLNHMKGMRDKLTSTGKYICYPEDEPGIWIKVNPDYDWKKRHPILAMVSEITIKVIMPYLFGIITGFIAMQIPIVKNIVTQLLNQQ
jgi:hypothetical protein